MTVTARTATSDVELKILEVARDILAAGGIDKLSMRGVAERVGISATAIYHYFENKQALVDAVVASGYLRFGEHMQAAASAHPDGSMARLHAMGEAYIRFAVENTAYFRVIFNLQNQHPRHIDEIPGHGGFRALRDCVAAAIEAGEVQGHDPDLIALFLWTCVHGLVTLTIACQFQSACEHNGCEVPESPVDLYNSFAPFIEGALRPRGNAPATAPGETPGILKRLSQPAECSDDA